MLCRFSRTFLEKELTDVKPLLYSSSNSRVANSTVDILTIYTFLSKQKKLGSTEPSLLSLYGWATWDRTRECQSQSLMPYRLAMAQYIECFQGYSLDCLLIISYDMYNASLKYKNCNNLD